MFSSLTQTWRVTSRPRRGTIAVLFAIVLVVLLGFLAVAVDTGMMLLRRTELQGAADAAVLAAAGVLAQPDVTESEVVAEALEFLGTNGIDPNNLSSDDLAIQFGSWDTATKQFTDTGFTGATAVRVFVQQSNNAQFFAGIFGNSSYDVNAEAIAITTAPTKPRDIMLVIDCSGSMDDDQETPEQPMTAVKEAAQDMCSAVGSNDQVGLTIYNWIADEDGEYSYPANYRTGVVERNLTTGVASVSAQIGNLESKYYISGTNIAGGIYVGGEALNATRRPEADPILVVLTDGRANDVEPPYGAEDDDGDGEWDIDSEKGGCEGDSDQSAIDWANHVRGYGIKVHAISLGDDADHDLMAQVAGDDLDDDDPLKGDHYAITGTIDEYAQALKDAFNEIAAGEKRVSIVH